MKVKLFIKDKSTFRTWQRDIQDLEDDINTWLATHRDSPGGTKN